MWGRHKGKQRTLTVEQKKRIMECGKWRTEDYQFFLEAQKGVVKTAKNRLRNTNIPFTEVMVPSLEGDSVTAEDKKVVSSLAHCMANEQGYPNFWSDHNRIEKYTKDVKSKALEPFELYNFYYEFIPEICATHKDIVEWPGIRPGSVLAGFMGVEFFCRVLWDLKVNDGGATWESIMRSDDTHDISETYEKGAGVYHKFTWNSDAVNNRRTYLCNATECSIKEFKEVFLRKALMGNVDQDELDAWKPYPMAVATKESAFQTAHLDMDEKMRLWSYMIHIPMQKEGSVISVFNPETKSHRYVYVPFGTYLALRGDVWHSGFYGNPGNVRFHIVIMRGDLPATAKLHTLEENQLADKLHDARAGPNEKYMEEHGGQPMYQDFLEWHERQTVLLAEAWERILRKRNGGKIGVKGHISLANLDADVIARKVKKKKSETTTETAAQHTGRKKTRKRTRRL